MSEFTRVIKENTGRLSVVGLAFLGGGAAGGYFYGRSQAGVSCEIPNGQNRTDTSLRLSQPQIDKITGQGHNIYYSIDNINNGLNRTALPRFLSTLSSHNQRDVQVLVPFNLNEEAAPDQTEMNDALDVSTQIVAWGTYHQISLNVLAPQGSPDNVSSPKVSMIIEASQPTCE